MSAVEPPQTPTPESSPPVISEIIPETSSDNTILTPDEFGVDDSENVAIDGDTSSYMLPSRSTRYSPERIRKSRYSMANLAKGNLTEMVRAFEAALYEEEEIPYTAEEAMKMTHWREAMLVEMRALLKSNT